MDSIDFIEYNMNEAYKEALKAQDGFSEDVPVGCVITDGKGEILARGRNTRMAEKQVHCHAEINALGEAAKKRGDYKLSDCSIFVTLEPCPMCAGALAASQIKNIYYSAPNIKDGACGTVFNITGKKANVFGGIQFERSSSLMSGFFRKERKNEDIT